MKDMATRYSSSELLLIRGLFALLLFRFALFVFGQEDPLRTERPGWQWVRGFLLFMAFGLLLHSLVGHVLAGHGGRFLLRTFDRDGPVQGAFEGAGKRGEMDRGGGRLYRRARGGKARW